MSFRSRTSSFCSSDLRANYNYALPGTPNAGALVRRVLLAAPLRPAGRGAAPGEGVVRLAVKFLFASYVLLPVLVVLTSLFEETCAPAPPRKPRGMANNVDLLRKADFRNVEKKSRKYASGVRFSESARSIFSSRGYRLKEL